LSRANLIGSVNIRQLKCKKTKNKTLIYNMLYFLQLLIPQNNLIYQKV